MFHGNIPKTILNQPIETHEFTLQYISEKLAREFEGCRNSSEIKQKPANSLTQARGEEKQQDWATYTEAAIRLGLAYLERYPDDIFGLYRVLADCRRIIGFNLNQGDADQIGIQRFYDTKKAKEKTSYFRSVQSTSINDTNQYKSFYPTLMKKMEKLASHNIFKIKIQNNLCALLQWHKEHNAIGILHCDPQCFGAVAQEIKILFPLYCESQGKPSLKLTAKIAYYFFISTPLERGSAATTEMLAQVLLRHKGWQLRYIDEVLMDLHAFFCKGSENFAEHFKEKHSKDKSIVTTVTSDIYLSSLGLKK